MGWSLPCGKLPGWFCEFYWFHIFPYLWGYGHLWLMLIDDGILLLLVAILIRRVWPRNGMLGYWTADEARLKTRRQPR